LVVLVVALSLSALLAPNGFGANPRSSPSFRSASESRPLESRLASTMAALPSGTNWNWVVTTPPKAPSPRAGAAMVYDGADGYTLLFGGCPSWGGDYWTHQCTAVGDTWELTNGLWTNLTLSLSGPSPPARFDAGIAYDSVDHVVVLFGGIDGATVYHDTWTYAGGRWTQVHPSSSPSARFAPGMAAAEAGGVLLFGGANSTLNSIVYNDTWSYVGGAWSQLSTRSAPAQRFSMALDYDPAGAFDLMYGGWNATTPGSFSDTWIFADGAWTELFPRSSPPAENYPTMAFDPRADAMIMTGGHTGYNVYAATWAYNVSTGWAFVSTPTTPIPSWGLSLSYDPSTGGVWLFGGYYATVAPYGVYLNFTWEFVSVSSPPSSSSTSFSWLTFGEGALAGAAVAGAVAAGVFLTRPKRPPSTVPPGPWK